MPAPRLRFKQFEGLGEWELVKLKDISTPVNEKVGERKLTPVSISAGIGFVPQAEKFGRDISGNQYELYTIVRDGEFVFNKGNSKTYPEGAIYLLEGWGEVAAPNVFIGFKLKKGYKNEFFKYLFEKNVHGRELRPHITSGARSNGLLNISKETFFNINLPVTSEDEQTHIAACLSSLDAVITAHTDKLNTLRQHKRALMQQLFPQVGERVPRLRFPEFEGAGEWEEKKLGDLGITLGGLTGKAGDDFGSGRPFVTYKQIFDYSTVDFYKCGLVKIQEGERQNTLRLGDVLITMSSETPEEVGYASVIREEPREDTYLNSFSFAFRVNEDVNLDIDFSRHLFHSEPYRKAVIFLAQGVTRFNISKNRFLDLKLPLPPTLPEQTHIAACLSSLDDLISAQSEKIDTLKTFKRGLMQGLFPRGGEG